MVRQRLERLSHMFRVPPAGFVLGMPCLGGLGESHGLGGGDGACGLVGAFLVNRIDTVEQPQPGGARPFSGFLKPDSVQRSQPEPALAAVALIAQDPRSVVRIADLQDQTMAVVIAPRPLSQLRYALRCQIHCRFRLT